MTRYELTPLANSDVDEIVSYVAASNSGAAFKLLNDLYDAFDRIAEIPGLGHSRSDLTSRPVKFMTVRKRYVVVYSEIEPPLRVLRVLSSYRDLKSILR